MLRARADIEEAKADLEYKKSKAERARRLQNKNMSVSTEELQQATSSVDHGSGPCVVAGGSAKLYQSQVHEIEESLANMKIVAPFDGTVVERPADLGEMISGGPGPDARQPRTDGRRDRRGREPPVEDRDGGNPPRFPSAPCRANTIREGFARSSRSATGRGARSR